MPSNPCRPLEKAQKILIRTHDLFLFEVLGFIVNPQKLETGLRPNSAGIPYTLLLRIEAIGFPTFGLLL